MVVGNPLVPSLQSVGPHVVVVVVVVVGTSMRLLGIAGTLDARSLGAASPQGAEHTGEGRVRTRGTSCVPFVVVVVVVAVVVVVVSSSGTCKECRAYIYLQISSFPH